MSKTAVLTDSASDIPRELEEKYGIDILPFSIVVDGQSYTERWISPTNNITRCSPKPKASPKHRRSRCCAFWKSFARMPTKAIRM
ncbi:MAG: DegV family protein [Ruthenibacterium lactatiformans]